MKQAIFLQSSGTPVQLVDAPSPETGDNDILVQVRACAICGSDIHAYRKGWTDYTLWGHEFAGDVIKVGGKVKHLGIREGDRVVGPGVGGFAEYARLFTAGELKPISLPDSISYEDGATIESMAVAMAAVRRAQLRPSDNVLIVGMGRIGLSALQIVRASYAVQNIFVSDPSPERLELAKSLGVDAAINPLEENLVERLAELTRHLVAEDPNGVRQPDLANIDVVLDFSGAPGVIRQALDVITSSGSGRIILVAIYDEADMIGTNAIMMKNCAVMGSIAYAQQDWEECVELIASGKVDRRWMVTHRFPLDQIGQAMDAQLKGSDAIYVMVLP